MKVSGLEYHYLYEEREGLYCGTRHPFYSQGQPDLESIRNYEIAARGYMKAKDIELLSSKNASATVENAEAQALLIHTGKYIGLLPKLGLNR